MFIVSLTYTSGLEAVDALLDAHTAYLKEEYAQGHFIASGRKIPRTGGIIFAKADSREALEAILARDPFRRAGIADYDVIEFTPGMVADGLEKLKD